MNIKTIERSNFAYVSNRSIYIFGINGTVILSNFRKTRTKDSIVSNRIFFKNTEKETANQTEFFIFILK